jgi:8-oxo-dGTP pyrophosphatase MutT (NUDIX family)/predicted ATPase
MLTQRDLESHDAVALVIRDETGRILCLFHNKFDFWTIPLGKAEGDQTPEEAAAAEAFEEVGIRVSRLLKRYQGTKVYCREGINIVTFFHIFEVTEFDGTPYNKEPDKHREMRYMSELELRDLKRTSDGTVMLLALFDQLGLQAPRSHGQRFPSNVKIGLSGASGAGKTTFARLLKESHKAVLHPESVRDWLAAKGGLRYSALSAEHFVELQLHLLREYEISDANVFDRSPLDCIHYASRIAHLIDISDFRRRALYLLEEFAAIVFFPPYSLYLLDDGVRIADLKHQTEVSSRMFSEAYAVGLKDKLLVYDHGRTVEENACSLFKFLAREQCS